MSVNEIKDYIDIFKNLFTGLAFIAAGGYFLYKVKSGYEILNAKVTIETDRRPKPDTELDPDCR